MIRQIFIGYETPEVSVTEVRSLGIWGNEDNEPCMMAETETGYYIFPLSDSFQIHNCNNFLRSLGLGVAIHFESYSQYAGLIVRCDSLLKSEKPLA